MLIVITACSLLTVVSAYPDTHKEVNTQFFTTPDVLRTAPSGGCVEMAMYFGVSSYRLYGCDNLDQGMS